MAGEGVDSDDERATGEEDFEVREVMIMSTDCGPPPVTESNLDLWTDDIGASDPREMRET